MSYPTPAQARLDSFIAATCLIPAIVLDGVVEEVHQFLEPSSVADRLYAQLRGELTLAAIEVKTGHAFERTPEFKKAVSVPDPRPAYYAQMRVWVAAEIKCHYPSLYPKLPPFFRNGHKA